MMTIRHFKIFIAVCEEMSMTRASENLYISQSAVSQSIRELESYYNLRLFERYSKKIFLTEAGKKLLSYAHHIIEMTQDAEHILRELSDGGIIRVGASVTIGANLLPSLLAEYGAKHPETRVSVIENNTSIIEELLLNNEVDLAIIEGEIKSSDVIVKPFLDDELILICASNSELAKKDMISPDELSNLDFIVRESGSGTRELFESTLAVNNIKWHQSWVCKNMDTIKSAVINGFGVSVISSLAVQKEIKLGELKQIPIKGIQFMRSFKIAFHKNKFMTKRLNSIIDFCINVYPNTKCQ